MNWRRSSIRRDGELSPTELLREAFLRLAQQRQPDWANRSHFYYIAARLMRQVLVDPSGERLTLKRGEGRMTVRLERIEELIPHQELIHIRSCHCCRLTTPSSRVTRRCCPT